MARVGRRELKALGESLNVSVGTGRSLRSAKGNTESAPSKRKAAASDRGTASKRQQKSRPPLQNVNENKQGVPAEGEDLKKKPASLVEDSRPEPDGQPIVWAENRQALCESLPYYRAYQSAAYTSGGTARGLYLGKDTAERAHLDEVVAITRAGGHCGLGSNGQMTQISDQTEEHSGVKAFRKNMGSQVPVVLIVGKDNNTCATKMPHEFNVLDHFLVTEIWAEKNFGRICYKYRFEKLYPLTPSWWAPKGSPIPTMPDFTVHASTEVCSLCMTTSKKIFEQGWMCLKPECDKFWHFMDGKLPGVLSYSSAFLKERTCVPGYVLPDTNLQPPLLQNEEPWDPTWPYKDICARGFVCPKCGRCNSRRLWHAWVCESSGCGFSHEVRQPILKAAEVQGKNERDEDGYADCKDKCRERVDQSGLQIVGHWRVSIFELIPGNCVAHFHANAAINQAVNGPDQLYTALQTDNCMGLKRFPMKSARGKGITLASHYSVNFGMPYKYVVAVESKSFGDAPAGIIDALQRLTWAGKRTVQDGAFEEFNELLAVGYFQNGKMGYHDDGEEGLSPTIATLSLGGTSTMTLRMKERYFTGLGKSGKYDPLAPVLPGCLLEEERKALNAEYGKIPQIDFDARRQAMYADNTLKLKNCPPLITMNLRHGDMVVMHGAEMQKYYEHMVIMTGPMRYALTCRAIDMNLVDPTEHWKADLSGRIIHPYNGK